MAAEGQALAFTGFPLGMVLGLNHGTHRALLAAITPVVQPSLNSRKLDARAVTQLQRVAIQHLSSSTAPPIRATAAARCTIRDRAACSA